MPRRLILMSTTASAIPAKPTVDRSATAWEPTMRSFHRGDGSLRGRESLPVSTARAGSAINDAGAT
ncbi:hypothetical protein GCM10009850_046710 [Nonomuraea monospora]|uniref:Secreted protein n=1 Tax=Nonomuraea monospora TaxID=568818 RepID=A0ABN3CIG2_9ACTN